MLLELLARFVPRRGGTGAEDWYSKPIKPSYWVGIFLPVESGRAIQMNFLIDYKVQKLIKVEHYLT